jgi:parallel beta-helix repeat protein
LRSALAATFTVVLVITMGITGSRSAGAVTTQSDSCVDGGGVRWTAKAIWGQIYTAGDMTKVVIDYAGWTTSRAGTVPTDSSVRSYDGTGHLLHTMTRTEDFNYASGTAYRSRNPHNPPSAPGAAKVTVMLGVDGDGLKSCTITFTQPRTAATPPSPACNGRTVTPGMDVQAVVNDSAPGSIFCFAPGIYHIAITPKSGQVFDGGNQAAILDGQNNRQHAFRGASTSNVTVRGFVVRNYKTPLQQGAIHAFGTSGWTIAGNRITRNAATGVATDTGAKVLNNLIDHNGQQGYAAHGNNILYEGNEIAYNNEDLAVDASWEAGGGKAWATAHAVFRNNNVHHNGGNGLWDDTNNIHITYDRNIVAHNWGAGIYHEIGYDATITNNVVTNNGTSSSQGGGQGNGWLWNAGIQLRSSGGLTSSSPILISGNIVKNNYNGIALLDSPAAGCTNKELDEGAYGPCRLQNIRVEKNMITMNQGATGVVHDGSGDAVFTNRNVRFQDNTYYVPSSKHPDDGRTYGWFAWRNSWPDWAGWTASGNDTGGRFGR